MHYFEKFVRFHSVLTNGETELEIIASKNDCGVNPGSHIFGQDGLGNMYIDGKPAHVEIRERKDND